MKLKTIALLAAACMLCACGGDSDEPIPPVTGGETGGETGGTTETVKITTPSKEIRAVWLATVGNMDCRVTNTVSKIRKKNI